MTAGGGGASLSSSARIEVELDELRQELSICEAELGVWKHRLAVSLKKRQGDARTLKRPHPDENSETETILSTVESVQPMDMKAASNEHAVKRPRPVTASTEDPITPAELIPSANVDNASDLAPPLVKQPPPTPLVSPSSAQPTPTPLSSPTNGSTEPGPSTQERQKLLQALRDEKAKAQRREKLLELQKTAEETLKKQRIARAQLELAERKEIPPKYQPYRLGVVKPTATPLQPFQRLARPLHGASSLQQRTLKRPRLHLSSADLPAAATAASPLEGHMYELPRCDTLGLGSVDEVVSHLFRVSMRWLLQTNQVISVHELEARFQQYAGKDFAAAVAAMATPDEALRELTALVATFPLNACVLGRERCFGRPTDAPLDRPSASTWNFLLPHEVTSGDHMLTHLSSTREHIHSALSLSSRLQSKESRPSALDLVLSHVLMSTMTPSSSALDTLIPRVPLSDVHVAIADLYTTPKCCGMIARDSDQPIAGAPNAPTSGRVVPFSTENDSPLLQLRAYRLHPAFGSSTNRSLLSSTYANHVDPMKVLCPFELNGVCNDDRCEYQHERDYLISQDEAYVELVQSLPGLATSIDKQHDAVELERMAVNAILSYHASSSSPPTDILIGTTAPQQIMGQLVSSKSTTDQSNLQKQTQAFCAFMEPLAKLRTAVPGASFNLQFLTEDEPLGGGLKQKSPSRLSAAKETASITPAIQPPTVDDEDYLVLSAGPDAATDTLASFERYYAKDCTQSHIQDLEQHVEQHPDDVEAWISLALLHVDIDIPNIDDVGSWSCESQVFQIIEVMRTKQRAQEEVNVDKTLHILARALEIESNLYSEVLWRLYLSLYSVEGAYDLAEEATRFLPGSAKLWTRLLALCKFESVAVAAVMYAKAIEKIIKHTNPMTTVESKHPIVSLVVQWCNMYVEAGHENRGRQLLLSILEDAPDKPTCLTAFQFDPEHLALLWLVYLDLALFGTVTTAENMYDCIYSFAAVQATLKRQPHRPTLCTDVFGPLLQGIQKSIGSDHLGVHIALVNQLIVEGALAKDPTAIMPLISLLEDKIPVMTPRLCHAVATTLVAMEPSKDDLAAQWIEKMVALSSPQVQARMYACVFDVAKVATDQSLLLESQQAVAELLQWTESLASEAACGVAPGVLLLHAILRVDGLAKASQHLDWVLGRPSVSKHLAPSDLHHLWSLRLQWAIQTGVDGDKVVRRYIQRVDSARGKWSTVAAAVEWCLEPPSRRFGFDLFRRYVASVAAPLHARVFAGFAKAFALYPPFFVAYAQCHFSNDRDRFAFTSALRQCIAAVPANATLLRVAVDAELAHPNKSSPVRLKAYIKSSMTANPIALAPIALAIGLDSAFGTAKAALPQLNTLVQLLRRRGILDPQLAASPPTTAVSTPGCRLVHVPQPLLFMPALRELTLSRNCLVRLPDDLFKSLAQLQVLDLSFNSLLRLPDSIVGLRQLRVLNVSHNHVQDLPLLFGQLHSLEELDISGNLITALPSTFVALKNLRRVNARGTHLSMDLLRRSIPWPSCSIEYSDETHGPAALTSGHHVSLHATLGPCAQCHKNGGKTQRFNSVVLCPKCILVALLPLL